MVEPDPVCMKVEREVWMNENKNNKWMKILDKTKQTKNNVSATEVPTSTCA